MEYLHPYIPVENQPYYESPMIRITTGGGELVLDHLNSKIRIFSNEEFNHIEYREDPNSPLRGFRYSDELFEWLMENDWRYEYLPYIDIETQNWWEKIQIAKMTQELGSLGITGFSE